MLRTLTGTLQDKIDRYSSILIALALALSGLMPIILQAQASALPANLTSRSVAINTSAPGATANYVFTFSWGNTTAVRGVILQFCELPSGTCDKPLNMNISAATFGNTGFPNNGAAFTRVTTDAGNNDCNEADGGTAATMYCLSRSDGTTGTGTNATVTLTGIVNPTIDPLTNNTPVYVIISFYDTADFSPGAAPNYPNLVNRGAVAASIVSQLTVTGRVQERLVFCVFALDNTAGATTTTGDNADEIPTRCTSNEANDGTNVDIGVIDNTAVVRSPVDYAPPNSLGNNKYGAAMINTNASQGVALTYYASQAGSGTEQLRSFRVPGAICNATDTVEDDQCFVSASASGEEIILGQERFGMQIVCVANSASTAGFTNGTIGSTTNLGRFGGQYVNGSGSGGSYNTAYAGGRAGANDSIADTATFDCQDDTATYTDYAWNPTSTAATLISSTTVVDDELVKFRYGATAAPTTPTGSYTVASTFIATPTF